MAKAKKPIKPTRKANKRSRPYLLFVVGALALLLIGALVMFMLSANASREQENADKAVRAAQDALRSNGLVFSEPRPFCYRLSGAGVGGAALGSKTCDLQITYKTEGQSHTEYNQVIRTIYRSLGSTEGFAGSSDLGHELIWNEKWPTTSLERYRSERYGTNCIAHIEYTPSRTVRAGYATGSTVDSSFAAKFTCESTFDLAEDPNAIRM